MKIYFDGVHWNSSTGPNTFANRLARQLSLSGHTIADANDYDVSLVFIEKTQNLNLNKPFVQRLDGIWSKPNEFNTLNVNIKDTYHKANHVIWQSDFDKQMTLKWFGEPKNGSVIHNGIELLNKIQTNNETLLELKQRYEKIFVCSANWHPQKRLKDNVKLFKHLRTTKHPYSCLIVLGNNPDYEVADKNIYYSGSLPHQMCLEIYSVADWMIHLAWTDHCPNVVCEALSQQCPVICAESGGTKELVQNNGIVLTENVKYNFELNDYDNPPRVDVTQLKTIPEINFDASYLNIKLTAKKYEEVFEKLI